MEYKINLGQKSKYANIDLSTIKGGLKKSELLQPNQSDSLAHKNLFNKLDADKNGILDNEE